MLASTFLFLVAQTAVVSSTTARVDLSLQLAPTVLDYELPGHPNTLGRGHVGLRAQAALHYHPNRYVQIGAGVLGRAPFALESSDYADAIGVFFVEGRPLGTGELLMRFGSLKIDHGYHGALVDEARLGISRNIHETYHRSIPAQVNREDLPRQMMPAEHGAQVIYQQPNFRAEAFLDWQLLETDMHREKFNFGVLGQYESHWVDVGLQFRLTHYGGQLYTQSDPIRVAQLDPVRQPESFAMKLRGHVLRFESLTLDLKAAAAAGHMRQTAAGEEKWHYGFEGGIETRLYEDIVLGYRYWWSRDRQAGFVSEDSDPVYNQGPSHRIELGLRQQMGGLSIDGRLDVIFPVHAPEKIQYLAITRINYDFLLTILSLDDP